MKQFVFSTVAILMGMGPVGQTAEPTLAVKMTLGSSQGRTMSGHWVALAPDGSQLAYRTAADTISIYNPATGKLLRTVTITEKEVGESLFFTGDSKRLLLQSMQRLFVVDPLTGKIEQKIGDDNKFDIYSHQFAWDDKVTRVVSSSSNFNFNNVPPIRVWDAKANKVQGEIKIAPTGSSRSVAMSGDGQRVATAALYHRMEKPTDEPANEYVEIWNSTTRERISRVHLGTNVQAVRVYLNNAGTQVLTADTSGRWNLWDTKTGKSIAALGTLSGFTTTVTFAPDDKQVAVQVAGGLGSGAYVFDTATGKRLHERKESANYAGGVGFTATGDIFSCLVEGTQVRVSNLAKAEQPPTPPSDGHRQPVIGSWFSKDGKTLLTVGTDSRILRWDTATGKLLATVLDRSAERNVFWGPPCAMSPDGKRLVVTSVRSVLIDLEKGADLGPLANDPKHYAQWSRFDFAADGQTLFARGTGQETGRSDFKIVVLPYVASWQLNDGKLRAEHLGAQRNDSVDDLFKKHFGEHKLHADQPPLSVTVGMPMRDPWASSFNAGALNVGSTVTIKNNASSKDIFTQTLNTNARGGIGISPDGKKVAIPMNDGTVLILE